MSNKDGKKIMKTGLGALILLVILVSLQSAVFPNANLLRYLSIKGSEFANVVSGVLVLNTNDYRTTNSEKALTVNDKLTQAAQMKADDMASKGYFSHIGPNGEKPWFWFEKVGYKYEYAGENLAVDFTESNDVSNAWINSAKHKANLLNVNFTEIGVGIANGSFEGHNTTFVVQFFGKPYIETENVVTKPVVISVVKTVKLEPSQNPNTAIATRKDIPSGEVLGTTDVPVKNGLNWDFILPAITLILVFGYAVYSWSGKK